MLILLFLVIFAVKELRLIVLDIIRFLIYPISFICNNVYTVFSNIKFGKNVNNTSKGEKKNMYEDLELQLYVTDYVEL